MSDPDYIQKTKLCTACLQSLPVHKFGTDGGSNYLRYKCRECSNTHAKILKEIKKTAPPIPENHNCPICDMNEFDIRSKYGMNKKTIWCCDHDHNTNTFRGWLCNKCNLALGNLNDDIKRLENATKYLNQSRERASAMKPTTLVSTYWSDDKVKHAEVHHDPEDGLSVYLYQNDKLMEKRYLHNYSIHYAEDCAENYVMGIIESRKFLAG